MKIKGDQVQAVQDAIKAILQSRMPTPPVPPGGPQGPITVQIDPNLKDPKDKGHSQPETPPTEIFDPKGLLQKKSKDNQLKQQQQSSNTTYHGPEDPANKPEQGNSNGGGGEQGPDQPQPQQKGDTQGQQGQAGQGQQQGQEGSQGQQGGEQGQSSSSSSSQNSASSAQNSAASAQSSAATAQQAANAAQNLVNKLGQSGKAGEKAKQKASQAQEAAQEAQQAAQEAQQAAQAAQQAEAKGDAKGAEQAAKDAEKAAKKAADAANKATDAAKQAGEQSIYDAESSFRDGWNSTLSKFDNDSTSDSDLDKALEDAKNNKSLDPAKRKGITDAIAAIKDSRIRPFEIDQETADDFKDKGLMLPKNTKIKEGDEEGKETEKEKAARLERIKKNLEGEGAKDTLNQIETDTEMREIAKLDKAAEEERARQAAAKIREPANFANFADDLLRAVQQQTEEEEGDVSTRTYFRPNPLSELTGLAIPGEYYPDVPAKPLIVMFIDQSGS